MSWSAQYVGLSYVDQGRDFSGVDCWGLARLIYRAELGIKLASYTGLYASAEEIHEVNAALGTPSARGCWLPVDVAQPFDLYELRMGPHLAHVGIAVCPGMMLHVHAGGSSKIERLAPRWSARVSGIHRHVKMHSKGA